jgi:hypothetical protein
LKWRCTLIALGHACERLISNPEITGWEDYALDTEKILHGHYSRLFFPPPSFLREFANLSILRGISVSERGLRARSGESLIIKSFEYLQWLNKELHSAEVAASCVSQPVPAAGIKQLEEEPDVLIVMLPTRIISWSRHLLGDAP